MAARIVTFTSSDGLRLEGRLSMPPAARGIAVLAHAPEPADGLMPNVLMPSLQRSLEAAGWASLRFNYRGIGRSQGVYAGAQMGVADVRGAIDFVRLRLPGIPVAAIGWSHGSLIALRACVHDQRLNLFVAIAPPLTGLDGQRSEVLPEEIDLMSWAPRSLIIAGTDDPLCQPTDLKELSTRIGAEVETLDGADHGFSARLSELGARVSWFLR